jgi:predicted RNase H-like HicB family nuclease
MKKIATKIKNIHFPVIVERGKDGYYIAECTLFDGCFSQGKTLDEVLHNIREVIGLCLEEKENMSRIEEYDPVEVGLHTVML